MLGFWMFLFACENTEKEIIDMDGDGFTAEDDCDDNNANVNVPVIFYADADADGFGALAGVTEACSIPAGYVENSLDCDDENADIHPNADELCDAFDNNCDGIVNDDAIDMTYFYADEDGDGFGAGSTRVEACEAPSDHVENGDDCDDDNADIHPEAIEVCDEIDNNCDDVIDTDAVDTFTFYADEDGDGYGDPNTPNVFCVLPSGYSDTDVDCDDTNAAVHPYADEVCDEIDNNCDEIIDTDAIDIQTFYADTDADGFGDASDMVTACVQPSNYIDNSTDCDDASFAINPDAVEVCDGTDNDCDGTADESDASDAVTYYTDADFDGHGDSSTAITTCTQPSGTVTLGDDCDDTKSYLFPGNTEACDGVDNDCDGLPATDELDSDVDGYVVCSFVSTDWMGASTVVGGDDCNDGNAAINPGAEDIAANNIDEDCSGSDAQGVDGDGDNYLDTEDCDDGNAAINPGATEVCDGVDNDCDGQTDEGVTSTFYIDGDGDGFGSATVQRCTVEAGIVALGGDCNDSDASLNLNDNDNDGFSTCTNDCDDSATGGAINPSAAEICDALDNNCDGQTDEGVKNTYYLDADNDSFGSASNTLQACSAPTGYVTDSTDCNDSFNTINPSASEICDGADNNCDSTTPANEIDNDGDNYVECDSSAQIWLGSTSVVGGNDCDDFDDATYPGVATLDSSTACMSDADADGYGDDSPSSGVTAGSDCDDSDDATYPGVAVNDSASACMTDADSDGYGDDSPASGVTAGSDCDDSSSSINTAASEISGDGIDQDCDGMDPTTYTQVYNIFSSNGCLGCHGGSGGLTITYGNIVDAVDGGTGLAYIEPYSPQASYLWHKINGTQASVGGSGGKMQNLSAANLNTIEQWILQGAPGPTYAEEIQTKFSACTGCHGSSGGFTLNYGNFFNSSSTGMQYITAGDTSQSYLWKKIKGTGSGANMATKPGVNLSTADFALIEAWIVGGALP